MKKISAIIAGLTLSTILVFGLSNNTNQQVAKENSDKTSTPIVQYSHAETW